MKRPSFQFYPADWRANAKLRRCKFSERGIWIDALCLLHDSEEYGVLRWPLEDLAQAVGCNVSALNELRTKGVLKGAAGGETCAPYVYTPRHAGKAGTPVVLVPEQPGPIWYSSRMVRDAHLLSTRGIGTRFGGVKGPPENPPTHREGVIPTHREGTRHGDQPTHREGDGASSSSSSSLKEPKPRKVKTGAAAPPVDPVKEEIWNSGKALLVGNGTSRETAGAFLGKLCKDFGQVLVLQAVRDAVINNPAEAKAWLVARCQERRTQGASKQLSLEARNQAVADRFVAGGKTGA